MPDPIIIQWLLLGASAFCAGMMGYNYGKQKDETIQKQLQLIQYFISKH